MAGRKNKKAIILSIHPKYANAILEGDKKVEFRRNGVPECISYMVLYATAPVQKIVGYCEISDCVVSTPKQLWQMYNMLGEITKKDFFEYYKNYEAGKCYLINKFHKLEEPMNISEATKLERPPQSFAYLEDEEIDKLKSIPV